MDKVKIGVVGIGRGKTMMSYCKQAQHAELVAVCDIWEDGLIAWKETNPSQVACYTDYDAFLKHDMDAVILANYANEHAPLAIKAMTAGKHVFSEVLPVQTLKEAVELIETVEETGMVYAYGENYCYMPAPYEMRKLYREGKIGEFEYAEGEYVHNCAPSWHNLTQGNPNHWRNCMHANFYCTHSFGPIIHITGLRPVSVVGFEGKHTGRESGAKSGSFGMEMVTLENGGIVKSIHGGLYMNSIWYTIYGAKGRMESAREDADKENVSTIYIKTDEYPGEYANCPVVCYKPDRMEGSEGFGHGGSDYYSMYNFVEKILGNPEADTIDVYEAMDMFLPGLFAYRSVLAGGIPMEIPNLRLPDVREKYRNDTACTDPKVAGDMLQPSYSKGNPDIPPQTYAVMRQKWLDELKK